VWIEVETGNEAIRSFLVERDFETGSAYGGRNQLFLNRKLAL
jgi:hypothetical protein